MGRFREESLEQAILDDVINWRDSFKASDKAVVKALVKVLEYFTDDFDEPEDSLD